MKKNDFRKLKEYQHEVIRLQRRLAKLNRKLASLPAKYGFMSVDEFIDAVRHATLNVGVEKNSERRTRSIITVDTKQKVKALFTANKTGQQISTELGISLPSVQNIKRELGLVKVRS